MTSPLASPAPTTLSAALEVIAQQASTIHTLEERLAKLEARLNVVGDRVRTREREREREPALRAWERVWPTGRTTDLK